jgi:hypothetical protein
MNGGNGLFSRHAERMTVEALADTRVVVVNGARQIGQTTVSGPGSCSTPESSGALPVTG